MCGAIVGFFKNGSIINCGNSIDITVAANGLPRVGGVEGNATNTTIEGCYNTGDIYATNKNGYGYVGGIGGYAGTSEVSNCYNTGTISCYKATGATKSSLAGGILGELGGETSTLSNCYNRGLIYASNYPGSIVGINYGTINDCYYLNTAPNKTLSTNYGKYNNCSSKTSEILKTYSTTLGSEIWSNDVQNEEDETWKYNDGYPILKWQVEE